MSQKALLQYLLPNEWNVQQSIGLSRKLRIYQQDATRELITVSGEPKSHKNYCGDAVVTGFKMHPVTEKLQQLSHSPKKLGALR